MTRTTTFLEDFHYVPEAGWASSAFTILRAGKVAAAADYGIRRPNHAGQDLLFCLSGAGVVETPAQRVDVRPGQLVWLANEAPHAHTADSRAPWTVLWFRFDGPQPSAMRRKIFGEAVPRVTVHDVAALVAWFERLFSVLRRRDLSLDFRLNGLVGEILTMIDQALAGAPAEGIGPLSEVLAMIRADLSHPWDAARIAQLMHVSASQSRRLFQRYLRESPRRWLIRERLTYAQSLMVREDAVLSDVAEHCGFCDVYYFSRAFKRFIGTSPASWRRAEVGVGQRSSMRGDRVVGPDDGDLSSRGTAEHWRASGAGV